MLKEAGTAKLFIAFSVLCIYLLPQLSSHGISDRKFIGLFANTIMSTYFKIFGFAHCFRKYEKYCAKYKNKRTKLVSDIQYAKGREKNIWQINLRIV